VPALCPRPSVDAKTLTVRLSFVKGLESPGSEPLGVLAWAERTSATRRARADDAPVTRRTVLSIASAR
jgi:hypothetical protein